MNPLVKITENSEETEVQQHVADELVKRDIIYWCGLCNEYHLSKPELEWAPVDYVLMNEFNMDMN